jgi:hypothetical protein
MTKLSHMNLGILKAKHLSISAWASSPLGLSAIIIWNPIPIVPNLSSATTSNSKPPQAAVSSVLADIFLRKLLLFEIGFLIYLLLSVTNKQRTVIAV